VGEEECQTVVSEGGALREGEGREGGEGGVERGRLLELVLRGCRS